MEVAGLDYEKVWYKDLGDIICHWRAKQWYLKLYFWKIYQKNHEYQSFYLRQKYLKASLFQCLGVVMILQVGIANTG